MPTADWLHVYRRALSLHYTEEAAAWLADHLGPIGTARPDEPTDALLLCAWGVATGRADASSVHRLLFDLGAVLAPDGLPPCRRGPRAKEAA